ncbi:Spermidine N(1)-acetyltransferase [Agrobacterium sp. DSM 25558]|uniref:GNAT family N-acetyltransferase n=1 Tax=Agrobacterium sp. DSM 25558 TaxID=1907665 RepID=UPI0009725313|nr:GNAT family N-acetyltransferase [Agrobacterium sp. DSM 25558]SCX27344.1 Spermidine N(1)-acetyltransferase [Agrobacterium sp. DSM 25558]
MGAIESDQLDQIEVVNITPDHIEGFHRALDTVAKERRYLTMLEAFPLPETRDFVLNMIEKRNPHVVCTVQNQVVGWCDITRHFFPSHAHRGNLGMGIIPNYRGRGLGYRLMEAALFEAKQAGLVRIELSVRSDNPQAIGLYEKVGFLKEGVQNRSVFIDGSFFDTVSMALMLDSQ